VFRWLWGPNHQVEVRYTFLLYLYWMQETNSGRVCYRAVYGVSITWAVIHKVTLIGVQWWKRKLKTFEFHKKNGKFREDLVMSIFH
jgi:hypothetical protein